MGQESLLTWRQNSHGVYILVRIGRISSLKIGENKFLDSVCKIMGGFTHTQKIVTACSWAFGEITDLQHTQIINDCYILDWDSSRVIFQFVKYSLSFIKCIFIKWITFECRIILGKQKDIVTYL